MLRHMGYDEAAAKLDTAVDNVIREGRVLTPDLGGRASTQEVTAEVLKQI